MVDTLNNNEIVTFKGSVRNLQTSDLEPLRPILATWVKDRDTGEPLPDEVEKDLEIMGKSVLGENNRRYFVALDENRKVIGVIGFKDPDPRMLRFTQTRRPAELVNAYVAPNKRKGQGGGVGTALVARLEQEARKDGRTEIILNSGKRYEKTGWGFYDKLPDYERVGIAVEYYGEGGDAPVWRKQL